MTRARIRSSVAALSFLATTGLASAQEPLPEEPEVAIPAAPATDAPPATDAALGPESSAVDDGELAELLSEHEKERSRLELYGFADFGASHVFNSREDYFWNTSSDFNSSFFVGNINLFLDANISSNARALTEVRFLYQPQNTRDSSGQRLGLAPDHADRNRTLKWGGVEIERAWVEYNLHNWLTIRAGQFLTPYGIWNVDHGSPTYIPANRPFIIGEGLFPERQTGFELYGAESLGPTTRAGYHLTLSNGRGPLDGFQDLDSNKALGGRVFLKLMAAGEWQFGGSAYYGRYTDAEDGVRFENDEIAVDPIIALQYDELALAADVQWDLERFHFQSELIVNQRAYTDEGRLMNGGGTGTFPADTTSWGAYGLVGYRLEWAELMPFVTAEYYKTASLAYREFSNLLYEDIASVAAGVNWRITPKLVVKGQYLRAMASGGLADDPHGGASDLQRADFQAAWSF